MKYILSIRVILICILLLLTVDVQADPDGNGGDPPLNDAPLDGGVSLLIAAGVGYGAKRMIDHRKNKK
jgi:hypothetical protein